MKLIFPSLTTGDLHQPHGSSGLGGAAGSVPVSQRHPFRDCGEEAQVVLRPSRLVLYKLNLSCQAGRTVPLVSRGAQRTP